MQFLRHIRRDTRGATLVEFALISPVIVLMLMGLFDMGHNYYVQSQLQGAIQYAARESTIETAQAGTKAIDARVEEAVRDLVPRAEITISRKSYSSFSDVNRPEDYDDVNGDGICNNGEPFEDANENGVWDEDRGKDSQGGARDAVLYVVEVSYDRVFPIASLIGVPERIDTQASTVLRNQPFGEQDQPDLLGNCP